MVVIDHEPHGWFLLRDGSSYVLDVNCMQSIVSFSVVLRLTPDEAALVETQGHSAADELARSIQHSPTKYSSRSGGSDLESASLAAIKGWQANRPAA
jgi:hypothetical protein